MRTSSLNIRKQVLMKNISKIQDEETLAKVEKLINKPFPFKPFTIEELEARALISLDDIKNGRVTSQEDLEKECERW